MQVRGEGRQLWEGRGGASMGRSRGGKYGFSDFS